MAEAPAAKLDDIFLDMSEILPGELYLVRLSLFFFFSSFSR